MRYYLTNAQREILSNFFDPKEIDRAIILIGDQGTSMCSKISAIWGEDTLGFTWGRRIWLDYTYEMANSLRWLRIIAHELRHSTQFKAWTVMGFAFVYGIEWIWDWLMRRSPYKDNSKEVEAKDTERRVEQFIMTYYVWAGKVRDWVTPSVFKELYLKEHKSDE